MLVPWIYIKDYFRTCYVTHQVINRDMYELYKYQVYFLLQLVLNWMFDILSNDSLTCDVNVNAWHENSRYDVFPKDTTTANKFFLFLMERSTAPVSVILMTSKGNCFEQQYPLMQVNVNICVFLSIARLSYIIKIFTVTYTKQMKYLFYAFSYCLWNYCLANVSLAIPYVYTFIQIY